MDFDDWLREFRACCEKHGVSDLTRGAVSEHHLESLCDAGYTPEEALIELTQS